jgi:hypothetical protein
MMAKLESCCTYTETALVSVLTVLSSIIQLPPSHTAIARSSAVTPAGKAAWSNLRVTVIGWLDLAPLGPRLYASIKTLLVGGGGGEMDSLAVRLAMGFPFRVIAVPAAISSAKLWSGDSR